MLITRKETQEAILEIQKLTEWSLHEVAQLSDLDPSTVTRLAHGQSRPSFETRHKINVLLKRMRRRQVNKEKGK